MVESSPENIGQTSPQHLSYNYLPLNDIVTLSARNWFSYLSATWNPQHPFKSINQFNEEWNYFQHFLFHVLLRKPIQTIFPHSSCDLHDWGLVWDRGIAHGDKLLIWYWSFCCCSIFGGKQISSETLKLNFQNYSTHAYLQNCSNSTKANDLKSEIF